ncbi:MAG: hypothetical protein KDA75_07190 [Planctomycetaceae bacterium]|nr:hypothetical protein [Planctomycetaceae bacterium]
MRFDRNVRSNPYLNRRDQFRLMRLVGLLAMIIVVIQFAAKPESWNWFFALSQPEAESQPERSQLPTNLKPIEVKRSQPLPEDQIYARVGPTPSDDQTATAGNDSRSTSPVVARLPSELLDGVEDDWFGLTRVEQPALIRVASVLAGQSLDSYVQSADRDVTFDALTGNPDYFRGRLVTLFGRLRRVTRARIGVGDDAREVWEAWVFLHDSHNTPVLVYALDVPSDMPTGEKVDELTTVTGYFIRRYAYASVGGEAITAMLIAPGLHWRPAPPPTAPKLKREMQTGTLTYVSILAGVLVVVGLWFFISDRRFRQSRLHAIGESRLAASPHELESLSELDGGDPHEIRIEEPAETTSAG